MKKLAQNLYCPTCKKHGLSVSEETISDKFFPEGIVQVVYKCEGCGFSATDVYSLKQGKPTRISLSVESADDLNIRIVKSSTAVVTIPELGAKIEPGAVADGYITNVEGLLDRIETAFAGQQDAIVRIERLRRSLDRFTLVIEDKSGNSLIVSPKARVEPL